MNKFIFALVVFIFGVNAVYSAEDINRSVAIDKSFLYANCFDNAKLTLIDSVQTNKSNIEKEKSKLKPEIIVELFSSIPKDKIKGDDKLLTIYNTLRDFNSLENIDYFSVSDNKLKTLFKLSYTTNKNYKKTSLNNIDSLPKNETIYFFQEDLTLGENKNVAYLSTGEGMINSHFYNTNDLDYMFLTVVNKENLHTFFSIQEESDNFKLYVVSFVTPAALPLVKGRIAKSFGNRLIAMYNWFYLNITK